MGDICARTITLPPMKSLREQTSDPARDQGHSSRTRAGQGAWAASWKQPGQRRTAQTAKIPVPRRFLQHSSQWQLRHLLLEGFESGNRHIRPIKFIGWLVGVSKSLLLACLMYQKFAVRSSGVSKVCCSLSVSTTRSIKNFQENASFSKI